MRPTKFSGPILYSGNPAASAASLKDIPISFNPDYYTFFDEFDGTPGNVPPGYNFYPLSSGTFTYSDGNGVSVGSDQLYGWSSLSSLSTDPSQNNSGGTILGQEALQANAQKDLFVEGRAAIASPETCEFFFGMSVDGAWGSGFTSDRLVGFELVGGTDSLRLVVKGGGGLTSTVENVFTFPKGSTIAGQWETGGLNIAPLLGVRVGSSGVSADGLVADFYVNRRHVGTIRNVSGSRYIDSSVKGVCASFEKTSEIAGLTIGTELPASAANISSVIINGTGYDNVAGVGKTLPIYTGQVLRLGTGVTEEDVRITSISVADGNPIVQLQRAVNDPPANGAVLHAVGSSIVATTQSCKIDYLSAIYCRYNQNRKNQDYLIDPSAS